jgi:hypothetical protein
MVVVVVMVVVVSVVMSLMVPMTLVVDAGAPGLAEASRGPGLAALVGLVAVVFRDVVHGGLPPLSRDK